MRKKVWLLLAVVSVLLVVYSCRRVSTPSRASGSEVPRPAAAAPAAPKPQPVKVPSSPAVETPEPQPIMPEAAPEIAAQIAAEIAAEVAPVVQEQQPSGDGPPQVEAIIAGTGNQFRALVGDVLVSEGSVIQGFRVRKVQADGVEFEKDGQIWVQKLD